MQRFKAFFADFPYELSDKTERHYQVVVYLIFKLMGQFTQEKYVVPKVGRMPLFKRLNMSMYSSLS